ncbi:MAG: MFS transporter [Candidatus Thorarchaeota archaeon]
MNEIDNKISTQDYQPPEPRHPKWKYASNGTFQFTFNIMNTTMSVYLFFYYEVVLGLNAWLIFLALAIFTVYDAIDDPIIGFLIDRNFKFTRKWGRRFPWIVIGSIPWCLSLYLIFTAPNIDASINPWPIFFWLLLSMFVFDTLGALIGINVMALRPDLFRTEAERQKFTPYWTLIDILATTSGMIIPPIFLGFSSGKAAYSFMGGMIAIIAAISAILTFPGAWEDKIVKDRYFATEYKRMNLFKGIFEVIKTKSFLIYFIVNITFAMIVSMLMANTNYITAFVLRTGPEMITIIFGVFILGVVVSLPFWLKYLKKTQNNKKVFTIGGVALSAALIPLTFFQTMIDLFIMLFILGLAMGSMWCFMYTIIQASVVDDFVVRTKKNQKAILIGTIILLGRLVASLDELVFSIVHGLTGFQPGYTTYEALAAVVPDIELVLIGIRLLFGIIPALILLAGTLIFWKFFPLTPDIVLKNKIELEKLGF